MIAFAAPDLPFYNFLHQYRHVSNLSHYLLNPILDELVIYPLVRDKQHLSEWLLSCAGKDVNQAGVQTLVLGFRATNVIN